MSRVRKGNNPRYQPLRHLVSVAKVQVRPVLPEPRVGAPAGGGVQVVVTIADASGAEWEREISRATGVVLAARARGHGVLVRFPDGSALDGEPDQVLVGLALAEVR